MGKAPPRLQISRWWLFTAAVVLSLLVSIGEAVWLRAGLLGVVLILASHLAAAGCFIGALLLWWKMASTELARRVSLLADEDLSALSPSEVAGLTAFTGPSQWPDVLRQLRELAVSVAQELEDAEQAQASAEIRARRARAERDRLAVILAGLPDPLLVINDYEEIVLANLSAASVFGVDVQQFGSETQVKIDQALECPTAVKLLKDVVRRKTLTQRTAEFSWRDGFGHERWYRVICRNLDVAADSSNGMRGAVAIFNDITVQKAIQRRNAEFVSSVSHEMKTPLSGIKAYVELLVDGDAETPEEREECLEVINGQTERLQRLIDNILNLARIESGVVDVRKDRHSLNEILEEVHGIMAPQAEQKDIDFQLELSPMYLGVIADRDLLMQAAINLASNAIKYTPVGGRVVLRSRLAAQEVCFEVEDTGVGLSEEDCRRVFDKFYRVKKDQEMAAGTGLGLPLAKYIIEDVHGGRLEVRSALNVGSTFSAILPGAGAMSE